VDEALRDRSRLRLGGLSPWNNRTKEPIVTGGAVPAPHHHPAPTMKKALALPGFWIKVANPEGTTPFWFAMNGSNIFKKFKRLPKGFLTDRPSWPNAKWLRLMECVCVCVWIEPIISVRKERGSAIRATTQKDFALFNRSSPLQATPPVLHS
jgi:hypothetical protein